MQVNVKNQENDPKRNCYFLSWQDLKDFVRKETKVETAFCQAHRDKVGEGLGKFFIIS